MCGFIGIWEQRQPVNVNNAIEMLSTLQHRGKDNQSYIVLNHQRIFLGHQRLSLIDLSERANQPMSNEDATIWLIYNGEIYNFLELRKELEQKHIFKTNSDSEVIIHGYEEWGEGVFTKLKGMFSLLIYDSIKNEMIVGRDRIGIKPLYYALFNGTFVVASEIKAILKHVHFSKQLNMHAYASYFTYRYVPSPQTIFNNVYKIEPANYIKVNASFNVEKHTYWTIPLDNKKYKQEEVFESVDSLLRQSIKRHLISDVPVGIFFSGGIDSTTVAYYTKLSNYEPKSFTIGFKNWSKSEHFVAKKIAQCLHLDYHEKILDTSSLDNIKQSVINYDEPIADISIVPTYEVSAFASRHVKAVLSGEGGDELFAGYNWHKSLMRFLYYYQFKQSLNSKALIHFYALSMAMGLFDKAELKHLIPQHLHSYIPEDEFYFYQKYFIKGIHPLKAVQILDLKTFLAELVLTKVDRASMAHTLEVRVPLLDYDLVEYMLSLHPGVYFQKNNPKILLFNILKNQLPEKLLNRPKQGFVGPDDMYAHLDFYVKYLDHSLLVKNNLLNKKAIDNYFEKKDFWRLWKIVVIENWARHWLFE